MISVEVPSGSRGNKEWRGSSEEGRTELGCQNEKWQDGEIRAKHVVCATFVTRVEMENTVCAMSLGNQEEPSARTVTTV